MTFYRRISGNSLHNKEQINQVIKVRNFLQICLIYCAIIFPSQSISQPLSGVYDFECKKEVSDSRIELRGTEIKFWESTCKLTDPVEVRGMRGATLFDAVCTGEGEEWSYRMLLMPTSRGGLIRLEEGLAVEYVRCESSSQKTSSARTKTSPPIPAFGDDNIWTSGWGQGWNEALVRMGPGNEIFVACNEGAGDEYSSNIRFSLNGKEPTGESILLTFDGDIPRRIGIYGGIIDSNCRACAANFSFVVERLKRHKTVNVIFENGDAATFPLKGSSKAIGECWPSF